MALAAEAVALEEAQLAARDTDGFGGKDTP